MMKTLHKIIFLLTMLITFSAGTAFAQNSFYLNREAAIEPGQSATLEFMLDNNMPFYGFQAEITLPQGIEIEKNDKGNLDISLTSRADDTYRIITNLIGRTLHIGVFSSSSDPVPLSGTMGALLNINVKASLEFRGGTAQIKEIKFIKAGDEDQPLDPTETYINILPNYITIIIDGDPDNTSVIFDAEGQTSSLSVEPFPKNAIIKSLIWESKDTSVATIAEEEGKEVVTAVGNGTTTIEVITEHGKNADCTVVVGISVVNITLDKEEIDLYVGKGYQLIPTIEPEDAINKEVKWVSNNEEVATVDKEGNVTALSLGDAEITAIALGGNQKTATCIVHVIPTPAEQVIVTPPAANLMVGQSIELEAQVLPEDTTSPTVTWTSSNPSIATVDPETGKVTAHALGETVITATCGDAVGECKISVIPTPATSITLDKDKAELKAGETVDITATVLPEDTTDKTVTWTSSDETIATVDENGKVTAVAVGEATITAQCGEAKATCAISVIPTPVESITLDKSSAEMKVGESLQLTETVLPENATDKRVTWKSSDEAIASVDENGKVTGVSPGEATITATSASNPTVTATCAVTVVPTPVTSISLDPETADLQVGEKLKLTEIVLPENATDKTVTWSSSDEEVATVADGVVTARGKGTATIAATTHNGLTATCTVTVIIPVNEIKLQETATLRVGEELELEAEILPEDASDKTVKWMSDNAEVATVDANGKVTAISLGSANITVTANGGTDVSASCTVTVVATPAESVTITPNPVSLKIGDNIKLTANILPTTTTDKSVTWTSSNENVATVDNDGNIVALTLGETTISAVCGNASGTCTVTVITSSATGIVISQTEMELFVGDERELTASLQNAGDTDQTFAWESENPEIVSVDENGKIIALSEGVATITVYAQGFMASCKVTVRPILVEGITVEPTSLNMIYGDPDYKLKISFTPENATYQTADWTSSDENVATVSANGEVAPIGGGIATITATSNGKTATCTVNVTVRPESVVIEKDNVELTATELKVGETIQLTETVLPLNASDKSVTWASSNPEIVTVDERGNLTAKALNEDEITITVTCNEKSYANEVVAASCKVKVVPTPVESISLSNTELLMRVGKTADIIAIIRPADATDQTLTWNSSDETIATVTIVEPETGDVIEGEAADGKVIVTALKEGKTTITAKSANGVTAICNVTVSIIPVEKITLNKTSYEFKSDETTLNLIATIEPEDATDKSVTWRSSDPQVATVTENGEVTAVGGGTATIYASSSNGLTATCDVTIPIAVTGIVLSRKEILTGEGGSSELLALIRPSNATDQRVAWETSDESIVTFSVVEGDGTTGDLIDGETPDGKVIVNALKSGTATITAKSVSNPTIMDVCTVTVNSSIIPVDNISIKESLEMTKGEVYTLIATISPENATDKSVAWRSSDPTIATVSTEGTVTAVSGGTAIIYATSSNGLTAQCVVTIPVPVEEITLSQKELLMREGKTSELLAIVKPANATNQNVIWTSSDETVATVDQNGLVTAKKIGTTTITATSESNPEVSDKCSVTVVTDIVAVENITLRRLSEPEPPQEPISLEMKSEETEKLKAIVEPADATDKTVTWKSLDNSIATVTADENDSSIASVVANGIGTTIIYASTSNGLTVECPVTVTPIEAQEIKIDNIPESLYVGDTYRLTATVTPADTTDPTITWTSSYPEIATIDETGNITAIGEGKVTITARCGEAEDRCEITVIMRQVAVTDMYLLNTTLTMHKGHTSELIAVIQPADATNYTLTWRSDNESVATVDENGIVTAVEIGIAVITAETEGFKATCEVTVITDIIPVSEISIKDRLYMTEGMTEQLTATILPENATDQTATWISLDESIATVSADGLVTAITPGQTTIIASSSNGLQATCEVNVAITVFDDGILRYRVISDTEVEVIGLVDPTTEEVAIPTEATYTSPNLTKTFTVTTIGEDAFTDYSDLKKIVIFTDTIPAIEGNPFPSNATIYVADTEEYKDDEDWGKLPNTIKGYVTIEAPEDNPVLTPEGTIQISSDIVIKNYPTVWTSSHPVIASVDDTGLITMHYVGHTTITATCNGYSDSFVLPVYPQNGDANWDGVVNVADPVNIANYVVKKYTTLINWDPAPWETYSSWTREYWDGFYDISSDINGQEGITVSDASETVSIILSQTASPSPTKRLGKSLEYPEEEEADALAIGKALMNDSEEYSTPIMLSDSRDYVALQADIRVAAPLTIKDVTPGKRAINHKMMTRRIDEQTVRLVIFDLNNTAFGVKGESLFEIMTDGAPKTEEDIEIREIVASDIHSNAYSLELRSAEEINGIQTTPSEEISIRSEANNLIIRNVQGRKITICTMEGCVIKMYVAGSDEETISLTRGIYVVTVDNKTAKFAVK